MAIKKKLLKDVDWATAIGNMPVATMSSNGLMSSRDKQIRRLELVSGYTFWKLISGDGRAWDRQSICISGAIEGSPLLLVIGALHKNTTLEVKINRLTPTKITISIKFYKKEEALYMFVNIPNTAPHYMFISTTDYTLTRISSENPNIVDDSYEEVAIE